MNTRTIVIAIMLASSISISVTPAVAASKDDAQIFHMLRVQIERGESRDDTVSNWDIDGWVGGDVHKLWLKSEGERVDGGTEAAEIWALYSRNISTFWDAQIGIRHDTRPKSTSYLVLGFNGLAPYFIETNAHLFVSDEGDVSARFRHETDLLVTQRLIAQPYLEANLFAQDVSAQDVGAGLANASLGIQMRYEITRKFAPYIDLRYERKLGKTASIARREGGRKDDFIASLGLRLMF